MRGELAVRINANDAAHKTQDRHITRHVSDLRFTKTAPGGHHSANMRISLPRDTFPNLGPADKVYVYDARTGRTIWEGYTENPGATDGEGVEGFDLAAMGGGGVLAQDQTLALVYIDRTLDKWVLNYKTLAEMSGEVASSPGVADATVLLLNMPRGIAIASPSYGLSMRYEGLSNAGLLLGGFRSYTASGLIDSNYITEWLTEADSVVRSRPANTSEIQFNEASAGGAFPVGQQTPRVRWRRQAGGATNIATDTVWTYVTDVWVRQLLLTKTGTQITGAGAYSAPYVLASEVVADLIGRGAVSLIDTATASIETTTYQIDQLAYHDGAKAQQVLDHLALFEPDMLWEILETNASGKHRFNYRAWPTEPRYEISTRDGYEAPGGEVDLCNRVSVFWKTPAGQPKTTVVTATVPELGTRTRDAEPVNLPDGIGTAADAQRIGEQVLAAKNDPPKAARATVTGPILDRLTGNSVMPWEIEPGYVVRVRETGDDLHCTEVEYVDNDHAAYLTLGEPMLTIDQRLAALGGRR